jgi:hypothetical protein
MQAPTTIALSKGKLAALVAAACAGATVIVVCAVLPAEFNLDPTGFGHLSGLSRMAAPPHAVAPAPLPASSAAYFDQVAYRTDSFDIPLSSAESNPQGSELEYKVAMKAGATLIYSWSVEGVPNPAEFYFDFHSESDAKPQPQVNEYRQATGTASNGSLAAPFDGIHGWYFQNQSARAAVVHLKVSGFYQLIPAGAPGNLNGIQPRTT